MSSVQMVQDGSQPAGGGGGVKGQQLTERLNGFGQPDPSKDVHCMRA